MIRHVKWELQLSTEIRAGRLTDGQAAGNYFLISFMGVYTK